MAGWDEALAAQLASRWQHGGPDTLGWAAIAADAVIALCYFAISVAMVSIARGREQRRDWISRVLLACAVFIGLCGAVHLCDVLIPWWPIRSVQTVAKMATAAASLAVFAGLLRIASRVKNAKSDSQVRKLVENHTRMLEEQSRVRQLAEQSVRLEVERIMRELAHDLKEPARSIASFTEIILERSDDFEEAKLRDFLERANKSAHRIIDMIQEMRNYALATSGNRNGAINMVPFQKVVEESLGRLERKIRITEARVERAIGVDDKTLVAESVIRVLQNLVENSIKYALEGQPPQIWITATEEEGEVLVEVRDTGMGFDHESAGHIFEPFHRLTPHDRKAGVGMGLAISRNIITKLGGRIWAQSDGESKGATFFFRVPTERKVEDGSAGEADGPPRRG